MCNTTQWTLCCDGISSTNKIGNLITNNPIWVQIRATWKVRCEF